MARAARRKKIQTCSFQKFKTPNYVQEFFKTLISTLLLRRAARTTTRSTHDATVDARALHAPPRTGTAYRVKPYG